MERIKNKYVYSGLVVLLLWKFLTWRFWSFFKNMVMQMTLFSISKKMDAFLASRRMSALEYLEYYENYVLYLYGWSFSKFGFGSRAFLKQLYQRAREERALYNNVAVI